MIINEHDYNLKKKKKHKSKLLDLCSPTSALFFIGHFGPAPPGRPVPFSKKPTIWLAAATPALSLASEVWAPIFFLVKISRLPNLQRAQRRCSFTTVKGASFKGRTNEIPMEGLVFMVWGFLFELIGILLLEYQIC